MARLELRDARLVAILDGLPIAVMLRDEDGRLLHANPATERMLDRFGVDLSAITESPSSLLAHVEVIGEDGRPHEPHRLPVVTAIRDVGPQDATLGYRTAAGGYAWYRVQASPIALADGTTGTVVTCDDVTDQHEARRRVAVAERSFRLTFAHAPIGMALVDPGGRVLRVNAALCDLLGYDEVALLEGGLERAAHPAEPGQQLAGGPQEVTGPPARTERCFTHASGQVLHTQVSTASVHEDDGTPLHRIVQIVDVTRRRALEQELRAAAVEDPLTGLANRRALLERLGEARDHQRRDGRDIGLIYLDLDGFKAVNDAHGHAMGDRLLVETGRWLLAETRAVDTVCRVGGDEFAVLCAPVDGARGLEELVDRLAAAPPVSVEVDGQTVAVRCSLGAVVVSRDDDLDRALDRADAAMYRVKRSPRGPSDRAARSSPP
jgi:diguanylate cyclase (GGDEF)-like protein/PAS domain S-box-containing protein